MSTSRRALPAHQYRPPETGFPTCLGPLRRALDAQSETGFLWIVTRLHAPVRSDHDLARLIDDTAETAVAALPAAGWAGVTLRFDDTPFTATSTDAVVLEVDAAQYLADDGPCLRAMRTGHLIQAGPEQLHAEWPGMAQDAAAAGVVSVLAAPVGDEPDGPRGSINLYSARAAGFSDDEADLALILAGLLGRGLTEYTALSDALTHAEQLQQAMSSRAVIEQAKGNPHGHLSDRRGHGLRPPGAPLQRPQPQGARRRHPLRGHPYRRAPARLGHRTGPRPAQRRCHTVTDRSATASPRAGQNPRGARGAEADEAPWPGDRATDLPRAPGGAPQRW